MKTMKHFIVMLLSISLFMPLTHAQPATDKRQEAQTANRIGQDVLIIIQQEQVRFTAQRAVEEMRLQIFDQAGQLVYDSGAVTGTELIWVLRQANGEAVKSGLYAYTLSVKEVGAAEPQLRRGHFIVDRAKERDGQTDRLWVTSQGESGVGTELTVARNEDVTIAGTSASPDQKRARAAETITGDRKSELKNDNNVAVAATSGTIGQIAKFVSATDLGNSVMTELNGKIGIGTTNPLRTLQIGPSVDAAFTFEPADASPNAGYIRFGDRTGWKLHFGRSRESSILNGAPLNTGTTGVLMTLQDNGNVGIGTASPNAKLHINGTGIDNDGSTAVVRIISGNGAQNLLLDGNEIDAMADGLFLNNNTNQNVVIANGGGNVGIGTSNPQAKLQVNGATFTNSLEAIRATFGFITVSSCTGCSTLTEQFEIAAGAAIEPGMVVAIDSADSGRLRLADKAYDSAVAGIVSGANGINPGLLKKQENTAADGSLPISLSGRVYCWADASDGPIKPGDLLTTSNTPGHAMKVTDLTKSQGAIIGKALTSLTEGRGLILILVTLR